MHRIAVHCTVSDPLDGCITRDCTVPQFRVVRLAVVTPDAWSEDGRLGNGRRVKDLVLCMCRCARPSTHAAPSTAVWGPATGSTTAPPASWTRCAPLRSNHCSDSHTQWLVQPALRYSGESRRHILNRAARLPLLVPPRILIHVAAHKVQVLSGAKGGISASRPAGRGCRGRT